MKTGWHEGTGELLARGDVGFLNFGENAVLGFDREFLGGFAGDDAEEFVIVFGGDAPGFKAERDAAAGIEDRLVEGLFPELRADFRKLRADIGAATVHEMAVGAGRSVALENQASTGRIAGALDQFRDRRKGLGSGGLRERENFERGLFDFRPGSEVEFGGGGELEICRKFIGFGEIEEELGAVLRMGKGFHSGLADGERTGGIGGEGFKVRFERFVVGIGNELDNGNCICGVEECGDGRRALLGDGEAEGFDGGRFAGESCGVIE